jgi:hypothetical protein
MNTNNNNTMNNNSYTNNSFNNTSDNNTSTNNYNNNYNNNNNNNYNNNNNNNNNTTKTMKNRTTSAPNTLNKVVYSGKRYYTNKNNGNTYKRTAKGAVGTYVGKLVKTKNGKKTLNASVPESKPLTSMRSPPRMDEMVNNVDIEMEGDIDATIKGGTPLTQDGGGCSLDSALQKLRMAGGGMPVPGACPFPGTGYCDFYARGGGCGCTAGLMKGGGCGCTAGLFKGGYRPTKKNLKALKKWRKGESIGFTMTSSLKAKGLIPRSSRKLKGKKVVSRKYR